jgi:hypothetical protein
MLRRQAFTRSGHGKAVKMGVTTMLVGKKSTGAKGKAILMAAVGYKHISSERNGCRQPQTSLYYTLSGHSRKSTYPLWAGLARSGYAVVAASPGESAKTA